MNRFCYCSKILPGKSNAVRQHWENKHAQRDDKMIQADIEFWNYIQLSGFDSWLQPTPQGDYMIHCLEGESLSTIFERLREQIQDKNSVALKLHKFYLDVLGKDYANPQSEPQIENIFDITLPSPSDGFIKRGFFYPLLNHKEKEHRHFRKEAMGEKKGRHEASMKAFNVSKLTVWLQTVQDKKFLVVYSERAKNTPETSAKRLEMGKNSEAWQEIAATLADHTGLDLSQLSPDVEWLTQE